jgi:hypothetical protein
VCCSKRALALLFLTKQCSCAGELTQGAAEARLCAAASLQQFSRVPGGLQDLHLEDPIVERIRSGRTLRADCCHGCHVRAADARQSAAVVAARNACDCLQHDVCWSGCAVCNGPPARHLCSHAQLLRTGSPVRRTERSAGATKPTQQRLAADAFQALCGARVHCIRTVPACSVCADGEGRVPVALLLDQHEQDRLLQQNAMRPCTRVLVAHISQCNMASASHN